MTKKENKYCKHEIEMSYACPVCKREGKSYGKIYEKGYGKHHKYKTPPIHTHYNEKMQREELCGYVVCPFAFVGGKNIGNLVEYLTKQKSNKTPPLEKENGVKSKQEEKTD